MERKADMIDIRNQLDSAEVHNLVDQLEYPLEVRKEKTREIIREYCENPDQVILGMESDNELVGFIGFRFQSENVAIIRHIAVRRDHRGNGIGREMILEICSNYSLQEVSAETDKDAVDFYRKVGFTIQSLGEKYPGTERFLCKLTMDVPTIGST